MTEKLDFTLPNSNKEKGKFGAFNTLLLVVIVAMGSVNLWLTMQAPPAGPTAPVASGQGLDAGQVKALATKLSQRHLYQRAAAAWQEYLAHDGLSDAERATALYQVGVALEKAGDASQAIEYYYRSEAVAALETLAAEINVRIKTCYETLGKFSALRYELMDRTQYRAADPAGEDAQAVAEIGPQKITRADLTAEIEQQIENQLAPMASFLSDEGFKQQKKRLLEPFQSPEGQQQFLQQWLGQELLYREALDRQLSDDEAVKKILQDMTRNVLAQQLMNQQIADNIHITPSDVETYYQANKAHYLERAQATISHILLTDEQAAVQLIKKLQDGADFAAMAAEYSQAPDGKETQGRIETPITKGLPIPSLGTAPELTAAIFASTPPALLAAPFRTEQGWEIVNVEAITPSRQRTFDEVRQEVTMTLTEQKRQEVQGAFIQQLMEKHNVVVHPSVLNPTTSVTDKP